MRHIANGIVLITAILALGAVATPASAHARPVHTAAPAYVEFANDETAAGDLDIEWRDNTDFEDDHLGTACTRRVINESAYGPDVYVYRCTA